MNTLIDTLRYFVLITIELIALFVFISALVEIILMYVPEEKIRRRLSGAGVFGNIVAAGFGALTPFCACSTIPMTVGFLNAGVPFGSTMSFLIASPLLNPIILGMLGAMVGIKAMVAYFVIAFLCSILFGFLLEKIGAQKYVKNVRLKPASCCAGSHEVVDKHSLPFPSKLKVAFAGAWDSLRPIMGQPAANHGILACRCCFGCRYLRLHASGFCHEDSGPGQSVCHSRSCRIGYSPVHSCRDGHTDRSGADGKRNEHRSGNIADYRRRRNGYTRNDHVGKYLQEATCGHDRAGHFPDGRCLRLSVQYIIVTEGEN